MARPYVVIVGSLNIDYIASVEHLPMPGQTVTAGRLMRRFGGKGANQAVAAARQGARVSLIGSVGDDENGKSYLKRLREQRIATGGIAIKPGSSTGTALIAVEQSAENVIIVAPEANGKITVSDVRAQAGCITRADVLLLQWEVSQAAVVEAVQIANRAVVPVVMNPSPARNGFPWRQCNLDTLIINEGEGEALFGLRTTAGQKVWNAALAVHQIKHLLVTRGAKPTVCFSAAGRFEVPILKVKPVDTVGAGDAFAGAFAARRAEGAELRDAVAYANCAGALATLKSGAQESIPTRAVTERACRKFLTQRRKEAKAQRGAPTVDQ
jgi:ribokinase